MEVYRLPEIPSESCLHLWAMPTPTSQQVQIALEELKSEYNTKFSWTFMGFDSREQKEPWYLALNPNGKIPMILDKTQAAPVSVMETGAILAWLAEVHDKEQKFGFSNLPEKSQMIQWIFWSTTGLAISFGHLYYFEHATPERVPMALDFHHKEALRLLDVLDKHLAGTLSGGPERDYVAGNGRGRYSYADMAIFPWLSRHEFFSISKEEVGRFSHLTAWFNRIGSRPAVQRGINNYSQPM
ncbi:glutathione S-transferase [Ceratobasidium sp. AG-Ba]|nr:glutathione S-transferase [Ceratobasidium sp. AG-Ba]QRW09037.1 glutathione S-transferase [Ceratobasidium sp. AG-Ba]